MSIFDLLPMVGLLTGAIGGGTFAAGWGWVAGGCGALVGGLLGMTLGRLPLVLSLMWVHRSFQSKSVEELRSLLKDPACLVPNLILLELHARGEDLQPLLPLVLEMLTSPDRSRRVRGWYALASAYDDCARELQDYSVDDDEEMRREKVERLKYFLS